MRLETVNLWMLNRIVELCTLCAAFICLPAYSQQASPPEGEPPQSLSLILAVSHENLPHRTIISDTNSLFAMGQLTEDEKQTIRV